MDAKRKVTVLDLESDGAAAVDERRRKADAAAKRETSKVQGRLEAEESLTIPPATESGKPKMVNDVDSTQSFLHTQAQAIEINSQEEHDESLRESPKSRGIEGLLQARCPDQDISQRHVSSVEPKGELAVPHPPLVREENTKLPATTRLDVSGTKTPTKCAKQTKKQDIIKVEYTAVPPTPTEITGTYVFDEFNKFMDEWLVPDEISSQMRGRGPTVPLGDTRDCLAPDTQVFLKPSIQAQRQITSSDTGIDWKSCFATCYGCSGAHSTSACPVCNQPMGGAEETRKPSISRKWTRWIFRQCEEPLDIEAEFLVTPRARVTHSAERDAGCYRRVTTPYQTRILGVTQ